MSHLIGREARTWFEQGAQARRQGKPALLNPFIGHGELGARHCWDDGWLAEDKALRTGKCIGEDAHPVSCDVCDAIFDAEQQYQEPAVDCQVGHDGPRGYVPSLCPACYRGR